MRGVALVGEGAREEADGERARPGAEHGEGDADLAALPGREGGDPGDERVDESRPPALVLEGVWDDATRGGGEGPALGGGQGGHGRRGHAGKKAVPVDGVHRGGHTS